jgi:hypothetical protein
MRGKSKNAGLAYIVWQGKIKGDTAAEWVARLKKNK